MPSCTTVTALAALLFALFVFRLRAPPAHPATVAEIEADGGRWVRLPDGRLLEYFTCGRAGGTPLYWQHGYGNTGKALFAMPEICETAEALGLRVVSPSQPGFGLSSTYPLDTVRTLKEWPADIEHMFQQERIDKFYVGGYSAGCIHALTIASAYPGRVLGVGIGTPTTPLAVEERTNSDMALPTRIVRHTLPVPYDQNRGVRKGFRGWQDNMSILNEDVPFDTHALGTALTAQGRKIIITTSPDDTTNPPIMQRWWADHLPGAELMHVPAGWGHMHGVATGVQAELLKRMVGS
eukprot:g2993.t1